MPLKDLLPPSLQNLKLRADFRLCKDSQAVVSFLKDAIHDFVRAGASRNLKSLELVMMTSGYLRKDLGIICERAGIKFGVEKWIG